ncbi:MAG: hypothetical protein ACRDMJ_04550 [Solirubrobacteraceae bacterium]
MSDELRISFAQRDTPEWRLALLIARLAGEAGVPLVPIRMAGGEARAIAGVHEGMAEVGVNLAQSVRWAYRAEAALDGWRHTSLRALGSIWQPQWLAIAVRWELRISELHEIGQRRLPLRVLAHLPDGPATTWSFLTGRLLRAHGLTFSELTDWGGRLDDCATAPAIAAARQGDFDVLVAPLGALAGPAAQLWHAASQAVDLRFLGLDDAVAGSLARELGIASRALPEGIVRGVGPGVRTVCLSRLLLYASERMEGATARALFEAVAGGRELLADEHAQFDAAHALDDPPIPPHPGVRELAAAKAEASS